MSCGCVALKGVSGGPNCGEEPVDSNLSLLLSSTSDCADDKTSADAAPICDATSRTRVIVVATCEVLPVAC
jgi:hypothetical protein